MGTKKLIILFIGLLGLLLVTACTREVVVVPTVEGSQEKVPVSVRIQWDQITRTKAGSDWEYDKYFPEIREDEQEVSNIFLVVFKDRYLVQYDYYSDTDFTPESDYSILLETEGDGDLLELDPGPHFFYAVLNIPDDLRDSLVELLEGQEWVLTKEVFEKKLITLSLADLTGNEQHFIMTNSDPPSARTIYTEEQIRNSNNVLNNTVYLRVGRGVAKISFAYVADQVQTGELHGALTDIEYKILNNPAQMYLMPVIEEINKNNVTRSVLMTPHYSNTTYPNGYFKPQLVGNQIVDDNTSWLPATTHQKYLNDPTGGDFAYGYCVENSNEKPLKSTCTMLLIKATFTPAVWVNEDGSIDGLNPDGTRGTHSQDGTFWRIGQYSRTGFLYAYLPGYYNAYPATVLATLGTPSTPMGGGSYVADPYPQGTTYYGFWPTNTPGLHQTKRNNYFKVAITHVHGAGYTTPGDVIDPDIDPEPEAALGRLAVNIENWIDENVIAVLGKSPEEEDDSDVDTGIKDWEDGDDQDEELGGNNEFD